MRDRLTVRLAAPLLLTSLLLLAMALGTAWHVRVLHRNMSEVLASNVASMRAAEELEISLREVRNRLDRFLLSGEARDLATLPALRRETDRCLEAAERVATTGHEQALMLQVRRGYGHFFAELDRIVRRGSAEAPDRRRMHQLIDGVLTDEILRPAHEYLDWNEEQAARGTARNREVARWLVFALLLLGVCGPAAGLLSGLGIARGVNRSLVRLSLPVRDAAGLLNEVVGPVTLAPGWGLADLEAVLARMAEQIRDVIGRMQRSQREALRAEQLATLGQMAAGVAHELRNPLMSMKLLVQAASDAGGMGRLAGRDLAVLEEEISRLEQLTTAFLDFARPRRPERRALDARELLEGTAELVSGRAARQGVQVDWDLPGEPVFLEVDPGQVRQVVLNLLLNAVDAAGQGGSVRLQVEGPGPADRWVTIRVADTGPGLPSDLGQDIFAPFVTTKAHGLGLGLSVSRQVVEAHGGVIGAADREGGGAVFFIRLPGPDAREAWPPAP